MSACKNSAARLVLPWLNKCYRHKQNSSLWRGAISLHATYATKYTPTINSNLINIKKQFRSIHTTTSYNAVVSFNLSDIGEGIREVVVKEWFVKEGDKVSQFDNICEVQSDKASVTITSRYDGIITKLYHAIDDIALVGKPLVDIKTESTEPETQAIVETSSEKNIEKPETKLFKTKETEEISSGSRGFAIPSVRRIAKENNIRLIDVTGTGKDGRVLKEDILNYINSKSQPKETLSGVKVEPVRGYTRTMIKTMTEAMKIPHFVYHEELRVTNLVKLREKIKQKLVKSDVKITFLPFFIKATSNALSRYPILNARLDEKLENIIYNQSNNIGVAMDTHVGLAVPVIKDVQNKNIVEISKELNRLQELGKQAKFTPDDLSGGTFTFSNIGVIGGTYAKPVILPPQSAIVALGAIQKVPRFNDNGDVVPEFVAHLSGAGDHRIIDGATMANFCNVLKQQIEDPYFLLLDI